MPDLTPDLAAQMEEAYACVRRGDEERRRLIEANLALKSQLAAAERERDGWKHKAGVTESQRNWASSIYAGHRGEWWAWQGDGEDHLESLTCPVMIHPDKLREILSAKQAAEAALERAGPQTPIQAQDGIPAGTIPLWLALAAHHSYQELFGDCDYEKRIGLRGGFGATELLALIINREQLTLSDSATDRAKHLLAALQPAQPKCECDFKYRKDVDAWVCIKCGRDANGKPCGEKGE